MTIYCFLLKEMKPSNKEKYSQLQHPFSYINAITIMNDFRLETDLLGEKQIPTEAFYGIQTARAIENFPISNTKLFHYPDFIINLVIVKKAAALTNHKLGLLSAPIFQAIDKACDAIIEGGYWSAFPVDVFQGGAGTSTNMNVNEVIANVALTLLGHHKGDYHIISPNDHVNLSQSTNDAYPTGLKLAIIDMNEKLSHTLQRLQEAFSEKAIAFKDYIKMGRTHLQDAVPMTLGQEMSGYSFLIAQAIVDLQKGLASLQVINMGATAIGTGINAPAGFDTTCAEYLSTLKVIKITPTANLVAATSDTTCFVEYASYLKKLALKLIKIANDLRLLSSGPRAGWNEINLPQKQPGSSIMPGKVNPVIPEVINQICYKVIGNDLTITLATENAQLQLNVMEPVIASSLFESIHILNNGIEVLIEECVLGITANEANMKTMVLNSIGIVTALNPVIGYKKSSEIAKEALLRHKRIYDLVLEKGLMSKEDLDHYLNPESMV